MGQTGESGSPARGRHELWPECPALRGPSSQSLPNQCAVGFDHPHLDLVRAGPDLGVCDEWGQEKRCGQGLKRQPGGEGLREGRGRRWGAWGRVPGRRMAPCHPMEKGVEGTYSGLRSAPGSPPSGTWHPSGYSLQPCGCTAGLTLGPALPTLLERPLTLTALTRELHMDVEAALRRGLDVAGGHQQVVLRVPEDPAVRAHGDHVPEA